MVTLLQSHLHASYGYVRPVEGSYGYNGLPTAMDFISVLDLSTLTLWSIRLYTDDVCVIA